MVYIRPVQHPSHRKSSHLYHSAIKMLLLLLIACLSIKSASGLGADEAIETFLTDTLKNNVHAERLLESELYYDGSTEKKSFFLTALLHSSPLFSINRFSATPTETALDESKTVTQVPADASINTSPPPVSVSPEKAPVPTESPVTETVSDSYNLDAGGIQIKNESVYDIDVPGLFSEDYDLEKCNNSAQVLIIHTHGSEAYLPDGDDIYEESDPSRTEDCTYNVVRIGDELTAAFEEQGITVIHDRSLYDYPSYTGSYNRTLTAIEEHIAENPDIKLVIDVHRDAFEEVDGVIYKTETEIEGDTCSQVMLVVGSDSSGLEHPLWQENLKFALHLQAAMNEKYPSLARPIMISEYRYNQHMTTGSLILEVGCNGNTLQESIKAVRYFADSACDVLLPIIEKNS